MIKGVEAQLYELVVHFVTQAKSCQVVRIVSKEVVLLNCIYKSGEARI